MLDIIGDILNWLATGLLFPLLLLPLSLLISIKTNAGTLLQPIIWLILTIGIAYAGILFTYLVPGQIGALFSYKFGIWAIDIIFLSILGQLTGGVSRWVNTITRAATIITNFAGRSVMWLVLAMAFIQFMVVVLRYAFGLNFIWMQESITYLHGAVFLLAAGYALLIDDHVRVDLFYREASAKQKALVNLFGTYLLLIPVCILLLWAGAPYVYASWQATEGSNESSGLQLLFLLKSLIPIFAVLLLLAGFVSASRAVTTLTNPHASQEGV